MYKNDSPLYIATNIVVIFGMENKTTQVRCSLCGETKDASLFQKSSRARSGRQSWCKLCANNYNKKYRRSAQPGYVPKRSPNFTGRPLFMALRGVCGSCGKEFGPHLTPGGQLINPTKRKYCSRSCAFASQRTGRTIHSLVCAACLNRFESFSPKRKYCSVACLRNRPTTIENTYRQRAYRSIKAETCEHCGSTGRLHHHHKDRDITNNDLSNIAILCPKCHRAEHKRMGDRLGRKPKITRAHEPLLRSMSLSDKDVAQRIGCCPQTVRVHRIRLGLKKSKKGLDKIN